LLSVYLLKPLGYVSLVEDKEKQKRFSCQAIQVIHTVWLLEGRAGRALQGWLRPSVMLEHLSSMSYQNLGAAL
jgi:hypothetical protein